MAIAAARFRPDASRSSLRWQRGFREPRWRNPNFPQRRVPLLATGSGVGVTRTRPAPSIANRTG